MGEFGGKINDPGWIHPIINAGPNRSPDQNSALLSIIYKLFGKSIIDPDIQSCPTATNLQDGPRIDTRDAFRNMNDEEYDFMMIFLKLNPRERPSYQDIFSHPYMGGYIPSEKIIKVPMNKTKIIFCFIGTLIIFSLGIYPPIYG